MVQKITKIFKYHEENKKHLVVLPPWENFRRDVVGICNNLFVSRALRTERSGPLHKETLYSLKTEKDENGNDKEVAFQRTEIHDFAETIKKDINKNVRKNIQTDNFFSDDILYAVYYNSITLRLKDAHRNKPKIAAIASWLRITSEKRLKNTFPILPNSGPIKKVREYHQSTEIHEFAENILNDVHKNIQIYNLHSDNTLYAAYYNSITLRLKDAHRNKPKIAAIASWLRITPEKELKNTFPMLTDDEPIKNINEYHRSTTGMKVKRSGGVYALVDNANGGMIELHVYQKTNSHHQDDNKDNYFFVPVYRWQVLTGNLPTKAFVRNAESEKDWLDVSSKNFKKILTIQPNCYLKLNANKKTVEGYYNNFDRHTGVINLQDKNNRSTIRISVPTINDIKMFIIDRFGIMHEIKYSKLRNEVVDLFAEKKNVIPQRSEKKIYMQNSLI